MANTRISNLTASASNLASTDLAPVVQTVGVGPVKMTGLQLAGGLLGSTTFNGSTVTTSSPVLNLTQTWNDGVVTFTGLKFNAAGSSDANSAAGSLLLDLQVGGTSKANITKGGQGTFSGNVITGGIYHAPSNITGWFLSGSLMYGYVAGGQAYTLTSVGMDIASTSGRYSISSDLFLTRAAAATLQLGAADTTGTTAPTAQFLRVQSWSSSTNNNQLGADFTIQGSRGTGTGAGGSIIFQVAPAGSSGTAQNAYVTAWTISSSGHFLAGTDNTYDIGATSSGRPRNVYIAGTLTIGGAVTANNALTVAGTLQLGTYGVIAMNSNRGYFDASADGVFYMRNNAGSDFDRLQFGGTDANFPALKRSGTTLQVRLANDTADAALTAGAGTFSGVLNVSQGSSSAPSVSFPNTSTGLFQNGAASEQIGVSCSGTIISIFASNQIRLRKDGYFTFASNLATDAADCGFGRSNAGVIFVSAGTSTSGGALEFREQTAPAAPAVNNVRIYAEDDGTGKTRLMARFNTGAAVQIAIEP